MVAVVDRIRSRLVVALALSAGALAVAPGTAAAQFGIESFTSSVSTTQAGAHADLTTEFALNADALGNPAGQLRHAAVTLPAGFVGNPQAVERCSIETLNKFKCGPAAQVGTLGLTVVVCRGLNTPLKTSVEAGAITITVPNAHAFCSEEKNDLITVGEGATAESAQVRGVIDATTIELIAPLQRSHAAGEDVQHVAVTSSQTFPLFNIQPSPGHVATFGVSLLLADVLVQVSVSEDGQLIATIDEALTVLPIRASTLTLWGVPAAASHDALRCEEFDFLCNLAGGEPAAFMTNPTACTGAPPQSRLTVTAWQGQSSSSLATLPSPTGCDKLTIEPSLSVTPATARQDVPAGYEVDLKLAQNEEPYALATPAMENVSVTLPPGTSLSPGLANGLLACTQAQFVQADCPDASRIGVAEVSTPVLSEPLKGALYIGTPTASEKYRILMRVSAGSTTIALTGAAEPNAQTGQVTAVFRDTPELPFGRLKLNFFGGATAALANPLACGAAESSALVNAYSGQSATVSSTFDVSEGSAGGACPSDSPFTPSFSGGTTNALAGRSSPFTLTLSRADGQQYLAGFTAHLPAGLVGLVGTVPLCPEPAAATGACGQASAIGVATIAAGAGDRPLQVSGPVYLTAGYGGAPFGLDIAVQANAGPFELGAVLVRSRIFLDPSTLAMTIVSDAFPQTLEGIPLRVRTVAVNLDRPGFLLNPTSCAPQTLTSTIASSQGARANVSAPFQIAGCSDLTFSPRLSASTSVPASTRGSGAGIEIRIAEPANAKASVRSAITRLPSQLRPRLSTVQGACVATMEPSSLAMCPPASIVGTAKASSPVTASPLSGPIYLVATGGAALPSLVVLMHSEGINVALEGALKVSARGVTSAAFRTLPDVPLSSFDLTLPRGPHSILGAVGSLCAKRMGVAYSLIDQSGAEAKGTARIAVHGCPRRHAKRSKRKRTAR